MSTTLTNGLKLPDKGSVDWYADMQNNYAILDGAVGTVAEHTTQIAGKANVVHTHTKSDITDFPAYGTTAGTICEGNDARLSDARTPVAHTHSKSDVTDLLNSNFIPSANNSYDLGSSSYQWNNLYAKNYYYNGVAWGLDKSNTWSNQQIYSYYYTAFKNTGYEVGTTPASNQVQLIDFIDKNSNRIGWIRRGNTTDGTSRLDIEIFNRFSNGSLSPSGTETGAGFSIEFNSAGDASVRPDRNNAINLGTSSNKWKTLNGINPGALSLPNSPGGTGTENVNYFDLSGVITIRDASSANHYTAPCDGWIAIGTFASWLQISNDTLIIATTAAIGPDGFSQAYLPVRKGNSIRIVVNQTNTQFQSFKLLPCEGNV